MARPLRIDIENVLYHVTSRGWERRVMVRNDADCQHWLELLDRLAVRCGWRVFAWVLMTNHFHLYLRTPEPNLGSSGTSARKAVLCPNGAEHASPGQSEAGVPANVAPGTPDPEHASPERQRREAFSDAEKGLRADRSRIRENSECSQIIRILTNSATKMLQGVA
jgi:hypothetical protein